MTMTAPHQHKDIHIPRQVHLVGIGGAHMSAIARILLARGHTVSGSDLSPSDVTHGLAALGVRVFGGHAAANLGRARMLVATTAAPGTNPEVVEAQRRGIPVLTRAQMVARLIDGRRTVAVSGSHGKTTTTSLAVAALQGAGLDPTFLVGGEVAGLGTNAGDGGDPYAVIEADEFGHAFLEYAPEIAIITNLEPDHIDYFGSYDALRTAFADYLARIPADGVVIAGADSPDLMAVIAEARGAQTLRARVETYAIEAGHAATWRTSAIASGPDGQRFTVLRDGREFGRYAIRLAGRHNVSNTLAVIAAAEALALDREDVTAALATAGGAGRRFEMVGEKAGVTIYDDYAHHPSEVRATLAGARQRFPDRRLVLCFQPHTKARTRYLFRQFRTCFEAADALYILETYAARTTGYDGASASELAGAVTSPPPRYVASHEAARETLLADLRQGDVLFTMGAGDVDAVGRMVLEGLR